MHDYRQVDGERGVWIEPISPSLLLGEVAEDAKVNAAAPIRIPGYWENKPGYDNIPVNTRAGPGERVVMFLHGGGYVFASAHPSDLIWTGARRLLEQVGSVHRFFAIEYRLSSRAPDRSSIHAYPAALIDSLSGYIHLLRLGFAAENIFFLGNSAGGTLAISLARYILENRVSLENAVDGISIRPPSGLIILSPWVDIGSSHDEPLAPYLKRTDFLPTFDAIRLPEKWTQRTYTGHLGLGAANTNRFISPASKFIDHLSFRGFPRTFLAWGGCEGPRASVLELKKRMSGDMSIGEGAGQLKCLEMPEGVHEFTTATWMEPERTKTLKAAAQWVDSTP